MTAKKKTKMKAAAKKAKEVKETKETYTYSIRPSIHDAAKEKVAVDYKGSKSLSSKIEDLLYDYISR